VSISAVESTPLQYILPSIDEYADKPKKLSPAPATSTFGCVGSTATAVSAWRCADFETST